MADNTIVLGLGGSILAPDGVDTGYLSSFQNTIAEYLEADASRRIIIVVGGGKLARDYQLAFETVLKGSGEDEAKDWIGIAATKLNAQLVKAVFGELCSNEVVVDPTADIDFTGRVLIASGWKPGFSTDFDAVLLAERFGAPVLVNLTDIERVYTADPKVDVEAKPIEAIDWQKFRSLVGDEWTPGKKTPFDPVASRKAQEIHLEVKSILGTDNNNLRRLLNGDPFLGTSIGPD